jgi:outer membrane protein assembly factor BamB
MKLYVDTSAKQITVTLEPSEKKDQNGRQRTERDTGRPMWSTQVFVLDDNGGEVITVTTAGERPNVKVGQPVTVSQLEALPWSTNGRSGVAFRATEIKTAMSSVKTA